MNGILKVTAEEHATGLRKQLTLENAVSKFRQQNQPGAAGQALQKAVDLLSPPVPSGPGESGDAAERSDVDVPADVTAAINSSGVLISKALSVAAKASEEDRQEIDRLVKDLMAASAARSIPRLKQVATELEDLVFYLQDA